MQAGFPVDACHAVAKYQQTVEKAVKGTARAFFLTIGKSHQVERYAQALLRLPQSSQKSLYAHIRGLLAGSTIADIQALDRLAPRWPMPGDLPSRNTEYPYQADDQSWQWPAESGAFGDAELQRYRRTAANILSGAAKIISAIERSGQQVP